MKMDSAKGLARVPYLQLRWEVLKIETLQLRGIGYHIRHQPTKQYQVLMSISEVRWFLKTYYSFVVP